MISLLVTGKHTEIVLTRGVGLHTILGLTIDQAIGGTFDKAYRKIREYDSVLQNKANINEFITNYNKENPHNEIPANYFDFLLEQSTISPGEYVERLALYGDPSEFEMPSIMKQETNADFSYAGVQTSFLGKVNITVSC